VKLGGAILEAPHMFRVIVRESQAAATRNFLLSFFIEDHSHIWPDSHAGQGDGTGRGRDTIGRRAGAVYRSTGRR